MALNTRELKLCCKWRVNNQHSVVSVFLWRPSWINNKRINRSRIAGDFVNFHCEHPKNLFEQFLKELKL